MKADISYALKHLRKLYHAFTHRDKHMSYFEVKAVLEYGLRKGYTNTSEFTDEEVDDILEQFNEPTYGTKTQ